MTFDLTLEFTHFNLAIRLSKVKQLAFFSIFTLSVDPVLNNWPQYRASIFCVGRFGVLNNGPLYWALTNFLDECQETCIA